MSYTQGGAPSYEAGAAIGGPLVDGALGVRVSDLVPPRRRLHRRHQPGDAAVDREERQFPQYPAGAPGRPVGAERQMVGHPQHLLPGPYRNDIDNYWPLYSNPDDDQFVNADPTQRRVPGPFLPHRAQDAGRSRLRRIDFQHLLLPPQRSRRATTGTLYNLGFYQTTASPGVTRPLLDGHAASHMPARASNYTSPSTSTNGQQNITQEMRLQSNGSRMRGC